jgi:hypothetical protein
MMRTPIDIDLLTGQQLEALHILHDGEWRDRKYIHNKMKFKKFAYSIISERIIKPLEAKGIVEQEDRPTEDGARREKKVVRIKKDIDEHTLHSLIDYSANDLVMKYRKKSAERANFFLTMRNESIKKLLDIEKLEEERRQRSKEEYWKNKESSIPYSESWPKLIAVAKAIADRFENALKPLAGMPSRPHQLTFERIIEHIPNTAFLAACDANPELFEKVRRECRRYEWNKYYGIDIDEWDSPK